MKVLELSANEELEGISKITPEKLVSTLKRESVIVTGTKEQVIEFLRKLGEIDYVERLFACPIGACPVEDVVKVAQSADGWTYTFAVKFGSLPKGKVSRKDIIRSIVSVSTKKELVKLPTINSKALCLSPYCTRCKDVCKKNAIKLKENYVVIDPDNCASCGDCVAVCPQRALSMPGFDDRALGGLRSTRKIWFVKPEETRESAFSNNALVLFWEPREELVELSRSLGLEVCVGNSCLPPAEEVLGDCRYLNLIEDEHLRELRKRGWPGAYSVEIDGALCTFCLRCVNVCPTEALVHSFLDPVRKSIQFYPSNCTGCGVCVDACPPNEALREMGIKRISVLKLRRNESYECDFKTLVTEGGKEFQCFVCKKPIDTSPSSIMELYNALKTFSSMIGEGVTLDALYSATLPLLQAIACSECSEKLAVVVNEKAKKSLLRLAVLYLSCLYRKKRVIPGDPLELRPLSESLGLLGIRDPCYEWERRTELFKLGDLVTQY